MNDAASKYVVKGSNNKRTRLEPRLLCSDGTQEVGQYYIEGWQIGQTISHAQERVITVSLTLTRDFFSIFMVTYLPTSIIVIFLKNIYFIQF